MKTKLYCVERVEDGAYLALVQEKLMWSETDNVATFGISEAMRLMDKYGKNERSALAIREAVVEVDE